MKKEVQAYFEGKVFFKEYQRDLKKKAQNSIYPFLTLKFCGVC